MSTATLTTSVEKIQPTAIIKLDGPLNDFHAKELIGIIDDISGAFFGFITTALFISFIINILQYFDVTIFEQEIKNSFISYYLHDLAPNTLALFVDFFPSLEFIAEGNENNEITT